MVLWKKALLGAVATLAVTVGTAQIGGVIDVGTSIPGDMVSYKYKAGKNGKPGQAQVSFQAIVVYFNNTIFNPKDIKKAKATGNVKFYLSTNSTLSPDDQLLAVKKINVKMMFPKFLKIKVKLTDADKGKYLLAVTESPQDQYAANNVDAHYLPLNAW